MCLSIYVSFHLIIWKFILVSCLSADSIKNSCIIHYILVSCNVHIIFLVQASQIVRL